MKNLKDFEKEINKCSKCGLCQGVCPIYSLTGNECAVSKGKFVMLSGVLKGDLKLNKNIDSYLDLCTKCGKCSEFCPAGINVCDILQTAKFEYIKNSPSFKILKCLQSSAIFDKFLSAGEVISSFFRKKQNKNQNNSKILYFKGCVNKIYPRNENSLKKILNSTEISLCEAECSCCGLPFFSSGNLERYEEVKTENTQIINNSDAEFIMTDCASCEYTLKNYGTINKKFINAERLINEAGLKFRFKTKQKITYHKPCHLSTTDFMPALIEKCENVEFYPIIDGCCGLAGDFFIKKPSLSNLMAKKRAEIIKHSGAQIVLTSCPACIIGLKKALWGSNIKVLSVIDFLAKSELCKEG